MLLTHYSDKPLETVRSVAQWPANEGARATGPYTKPVGLWVSVDGEDDWIWWCRAEGFGLERLTHAHRVTLAKNARVLRLAGANELDAFTAEYGGLGPDYMPEHLKSLCIDWWRVAAGYQGVIIAPYCYERRLNLSWYYPWDCASGCIWDASAIASVEPISAPEMAR